MPLEDWNTIISAGTLIVIAATAIAAAIQLRHLRSSNQITTALSLFDKWGGPEARKLQAFVFGGELDEKLKDPAYRAELMHIPVNRISHPEVAYLDFWESVCTLIKLGHTDEASFMETGGFMSIAAWNKLMPVIAIIRRKRGSSPYDNFEYVVSRAIIWEQKHPDTFPKDAPRLPVVDGYPGDSAQ
ncbi:MAG: hypothetical protein JO347_01415 [Candidatus Eremiobacteraeota bacterium]|nr:hypothetical protein [Candidatus Eremiobacteraeota bacterium]MBV8280703.1 hypothetical protein [Candidatus Eremiobacteraeota bacterium]